jgi:hypothetical protein
MPLRGSVMNTADLTALAVDRMYALMDAYFIGSERCAFECDLFNKPWVIALHDPDTGRLHGFSTLCLMEEVVDGVAIRAFFSGDTIIDQPYWGSFELERVWCRFLFTQIEADPSIRWYWFLICKGYRTYRYLPVFFYHYFPSPEAMPPFEQSVLNRLATRRFGNAYDPVTGVITCANDYRLRPGVGDIAERELRDPRIAFFQQRNPGWQGGTELACLTELHLHNLKPRAHRFLREAITL